MKILTTLWLCLSSLLLSNCASPVTGVTPKPDVTPVVQSNRAIQASAKKLHESNKQTLKLNQSIQESIDSAIGDLDKLLGK